VKRTAATHSLQHNTITTAMELFDFANSNIKNVIVFGFLRKILMAKGIFLRKDI